MANLYSVDPPQAAAGLAFAVELAAGGGVDDNDDDGADADDEDDGDGLSAGSSFASLL